MRIDIDDKYVITSDSRNFILSKKEIRQTGKHKGEEVLKHFGFYHTLNNLFDAFFELRVKKSTAKSFKELHADVILAKQEIKQLSKGL